MHPIPAEIERRTRAACHDGCFACGTLSDLGLQVSFHCHAPGEVTAKWLPEEHCRSYEGRLHGGLVATLLDAAMVHALFSLGKEGVTASMNLRYHLPVVLDAPVELEARRIRSAHGLHRMEASIVQLGALRAHASARFADAKLILGPGTAEFMSYGVWSPPGCKDTPPPDVCLEP
jgi:acyl-coenzyme A thioesterase PaaI-like protein